MSNLKLLATTSIFLACVMTMNACSDKQQESANGITPQQSNPALTQIEPSSVLQVGQQWIAGWYPTQGMLTNRAGSAAVVHNDTIYMIGGVDGIDFLKSTEYAKIQPDGTLSAWQAGPTLQEERGFIDAVVNGGYIYVVGGGNGPNGHNLLRSVERAKIFDDGSLGQWEVEQNSMLTPRRCSKVLAVGNYLYSLGGFAGVLLDTVERAQIQADGHLGEWVIDDTHMTIPRYIDTVKNIDDTLYVIGGHDQTKGVGITNVEWGIPSSNGSIKEWMNASPLQTGRYGLTSAKYGNRLYALGGLTGLEYLESVETTEVVNDKPGPWRYTTALSVPRATFSTVSYKDKIYVLGGTNQDHYLNSVEFATVNDSGDLGFWGTEQDAKGYAEFKEQLKQQKPDLPNQGIVVHVQQASMYTYANVNSNIGDIWIAGPKMDGLKVGDNIQFSKGVSMSNFYSKELQQQFPMLLFVGKINITQEKR